MPFRSFLSFVLPIAFLFAFGSVNVQSQTRLPAIIGSSMVLQQQDMAPIWGWDTPGQAIIISASWLEETQNTTSNSQGKWKVELPTPVAGGPYKITISGSEKIELENVLIGEVWLCSGQSNMEMPLKGWDGQPVTGSKQAIDAADHPEIRLFTVTRATSYEPLDDCEGNWVECSPETAPSFSATGYFFGLELYQKLGVPVGLIHSSWGGTPSEAWTSKEYIGKVPFFQSTPGRADPQAYRQKKLDAYEIVKNNWLKSVGFLPDSDKSPQWANPNFDVQDWIKIEVPEKWENTKLGKYRGMVEMRVEFKISSKMAGKALKLELGPIDEIDITWVNGVKVGMQPYTYYWNTPRVYNIPEGLTKKGKNTLAVKVGNTNGAGGICGSKEQLRIYPEGEEESYKIIKGKWFARKSRSLGDFVPMPWCDNCAEPNTPTTLYNGMINPLIPFQIKGAIWYQGESNRYDGKLYGTIFPNMITNWRDSWNQGDFSFYYVQIAPYTYRDELSTGLLKESQQNAMMLLNTGMVATGDIGDLATIHPPDKSNVGKRLAYWALARDYNKDIEFSGPLYKESRIEGAKIRIVFDYAGEGLKIEGDELKHIQIAGRDRKFKKAEAKIEGKTLVVYSSDVKSPIAVRFGWGSLDQTNLFNIAGLPAGPFRTDRWDD